jgi:hypothetical protein
MAHYNYISVQLIPAMQAELHVLLSGAGIAAAPKHDFHCTLIYDERKEQLTEPLAKLDPKREFQANVVALEILGDGLVFRMTSKDLHAEHIRLEEAGHIHAYEGYLPHMTLGYDLNKYEILMLETLMTGWMGRTLTFTAAAYG